MSTRCNVCIVTKTGIVYMYHHCDGYIEGVGFDLVEKLINCGKTNKCITSDDFLSELIKDKSYEFSTCGLHSDIEYLYTVDPEKHRIMVQKVPDYDALTKFGILIDVIEEYNKQHRT